MNDCKLFRCMIREYNNMFWTIYLKHLVNDIRNDVADRSNRERNDDEIEVPDSVWENEKNHSHPYLVLMPGTHQGIFL